MKMKEYVLIFAIMYLLLMAALSMARGAFDKLGEQVAGGFAIAPHTEKNTHIHAIGPIEVRCRLGESSVRSSNSEQASIQISRAVKISSSAA